MPPKNIYLINPFITKSDVPDQYFCDRETETARLISSALNGNNTVLTAERRIGKSTLLKHVMRQKEVTENFNTLFVDIYKTTDLKRFVEVLSNALLESEFGRGERASKKLMDAIPEIKFFAKLQAGPISAGIETSLKNEYRGTLDRIFKFLRETSRPNLVTIDEFQTIEKYEGEKMAETLRTYMQATPNTQFIFSGSQRHMLHSMFKDANKPFYKSALPMELQMIPEKTYTEFCQRLFTTKQRKITEEAVHFAYTLFQGNTFEMQQIMNRVFSYTPLKAIADVENVRYAVTDLMEENEANYRFLFTMQNAKKERTEKEKNLLRCIGIEGLASTLMSTEMSTTYSLGGASSIQSSLDKLTEGDSPVVNKIGNSSFRLSDTMFELWIAAKNDLLEEKFEAAESRFKSEQEAMKDNPMNNLPKIKRRKSPDGENKR